MTRHLSELDANQSLSKALMILKMLSSTQGDIGVRELGRRLAIPPSVVHRLLATLKNHDFVEQDPRTMRYRTGYGLYEAGQSYLVQRTLADAAFEELQKVAKNCNMAAYLGAMHDTEMVYFLSLPSPPIHVYPQPGRTAPLHSTSIGKIALARLENNELATFLQTLDMPRLTASTIVEPIRLYEEVVEVRENGYSTCLGENIEGIYAIGVPVLDSRGDIVAGISLASPGPEIFQDIRDSALEQLRRASAIITERLSRLVSIPDAGSASGRRQHA